MQGPGVAPTEPARRVRDARRSGDLEGARRLALALVAEHPGHAELQYEAACVHDQLGLEVASAGDLDGDGSPNLQIQLDGINVFDPNWIS